LNEKYTVKASTLLKSQFSGKRKKMEDLKTSRKNI
jgi:hypothetical protein